jgi:hypothetical protein
MITLQDTSHYYHYNYIFSAAQTYATAEMSLTNYHLQIYINVATHANRFTFNIRSSFRHCLICLKSGTLTSKREAES